MGRQKELAADYQVETCVPRVGEEAHAIGHTFRPAELGRPRMTLHRRRAAVADYPIAEP
jgi:hypothetical protein